MEITIKIVKKHQKQYDYDYFEVQEKGTNHKFIGMKEDVLAKTEQFLDALREEKQDDTR